MTLSKIYKVINIRTDYVYVNATKQNLSQRMATIRLNARRGSKGHIYDLFRTYGANCFNIVLLEVVEYEKLEELNKIKYRWEYSFITHGSKIEKKVCMNKCLYCDKRITSIKQRRRHYKTRDHITITDIYYRINYNFVIDEINKRM